MKNDETQLFAGRRMALALWLALLGGLGAALTYSGLSPLQLVQKAAALGDHWWAPIAFITLFTLRTPTFLSSALDKDGGKLAPICDCPGHLPERLGVCD